MQIENISGKRNPFCILPLLVVTASLEIYVATACALLGDASNHVYRFNLWLQMWKNGVLPMVAG
jgi:hypothetical protein